ncbi:unnamed protein product [Peronospora belbahrii]|uniref:V-SNARE coiled-coil homology domain-containing protein n=1 Tax=Peronospora belbahrii TaxID=622444 RepID=A0AAU9KL76_9STRA|nr:unnamed protein product [Peronospora belbahrii]
MQQAIVVKFGSNALTFRENGLSKVCMKFFIAIATTYDDRTKVDKLSKVMNRVDDGTTIMHHNLELVLSDMEKIKVVKQKTNDLSDQ